MSLWWDEEGVVERERMVRIESATLGDVEKLTEIQTRTFDDDNKWKPSGCSLEGPPGYDSVDWNAGWIVRTPYYRIVFDGQIVGGLIVFDLGEGCYELGRIWVDPDFQNRGIGQHAVRLVFETFPEATRWTVGTPSWAVRNQHFYEKVGFVKVGEVNFHLFLLFDLLHQFFIFFLLFFYSPDGPFLFLGFHRDRFLFVLQISYFHL